MKRLGGKLLTLVVILFLPFGTTNASEVWTGLWKDPEWKSEWKQHKDTPIFWRHLRWGDPNEGYSRVVEIYNGSLSKLHIVGLATTIEGSHFIDLEQPGAFQRTIYPRKSQLAYVDGPDADNTFGPKTVWMIIQDFLLED